MSYAWMQGCAKMGMTFAAFGPRELVAQVDHKVMEQGQRHSRSDGSIHRSHIGRKLPERSGCYLYRHLGIHGRRG